MTDSSVVSRRPSSMEVLSLCLVSAWSMAMFIAVGNIVSSCLSEFGGSAELLVFPVVAAFLIFVGALTIADIVVNPYLINSPNFHHALCVCYTACFLRYFPEYAGFIGRSGYWLQDLAVMALILQSGYFVVQLPYKLYEEVMRKKEGFSLSSFASVTAVEASAAFALDLMLYAAVFAVISIHSEYWWMLTAFCYFAAGVVWHSLQAGVLQFYGTDTERLENLPPALAALLERSGIKRARYFQYDTKHRLGYSDGLCYSIGPIYTIGLHKDLIGRQVSDDVEWVFAHELGHAVSQDVLKREAVSAFVIAVGLWLCAQFLGQSAEGWSYLENLQHLPALLLVTNLSRFVFQWLEKYFIRCQERGADLYALELVGNARGMLGFCRFHLRDRLPPARPPGLLRRVYEWLGRTHPTLEERLAVAWNWGMSRAERVASMPPVSNR